MATYTIRQDGDAVAIDLEGVGSHQAELLEAFGECQEGRCSCPTDEYAKLEAMSVEPSESGIAIRLEPKAGEILDKSELAACLDYTVRRAGA